MFDSFQPTLATYLPALLAEDGLVVVETASATSPSSHPSRAHEQNLWLHAVTLFEQQ